MNAIEKGLDAYLKSIGKQAAFGVHVMLQSQDGQTTIAKKWETENTIGTWWDENEVGTRISENDLAAIGQAVDTLLLTPDKMVILPDGVDSVTINIESPNTTTSAVFTYRITTPEGDVWTGTEAFNNGEAVLIFSTEQVGNHEVYIYAGIEGTGVINIGTG